MRGEAAGGGRWVTGTEGIEKDTSPVGGVNHSTKSYDWSEGEVTHPRELGGATLVSAEMSG